MSSPAFPDAAASIAPVTVWWAWRSQAGELDRTVLSPRERARVERLHLEADRDRSALARIVLRHALARRIGGAPAAIALDWQHGPALDPQHGLWASIAHSHDGVAVAISSAGPVGVDVEPFTRGVDLHAGVRERVFTLHEREHLTSLPDDELLDSAVELWTAKEALLKAVGGRLVHPPASVEVHRNGGVPRLVQFADRDDLIDGARLSVVRPPATGDQAYVATVAVLGVPELASIEVASLDAADLLG